MSAKTDEVSGHLELLYPSEYIKVADLRYPGGFALTPADASVLQQPVTPAGRKGKK